MLDVGVSADQPQGESPVDKQVLNSSVDVCLEDDEYQEQVLKRVLSPVEGGEEGESTGQEEIDFGLSPESSTPKPQKGSQEFVGGGESHVDPLLFEMEEEEEEGGEETESVSSESTLQSEPQRASRVTVEAASSEVGKSLAEEFSEEGVEVPEEWEGGEGVEVGEEVEVGKEVEADEEVEAGVEVEGDEGQLGELEQGEYGV